MLMPSARLWPPLLLIIFLLLLFKPMRGRPLAGDVQKPPHQRKQQQQQQEKKQHLQQLKEKANMVYPSVLDYAIDGGNWQPTSPMARPGPISNINRPSTIIS
ncbi:hypothetical protein KP509_01G070200 [Ceratopteris richardii]|uniref:Secreted protein n=1 Tax=Ceratopteris richardii TaxID=49495 RepID=A0A8T2VKQ8_CERRI|nr:hypothetical protein KP509_01G070200 [Ceratopteris richardii]